MAWGGKKVKVVKVKPDDIADNDQEKLARALEKFGFKAVMMVDIEMPDGRIVKGAMARKSDE